MAIILLACGPCVVILNCLGHVLYLGRAPRTKETLLDFHEWCRVTRHPRVFRWLMGCQRTSGFGVSHFQTLKNPSLVRNIFVWSHHLLFIFIHYGENQVRTKKPFIDSS